MAQLNKTIPASVAAPEGQLTHHEGRIVLVFSVALILMFAAIVLVAPRLSPPAAPTPAAATGPVTDGWMSGVQAANRARLIETANMTTDGWMARYLPSANALEITDGWMSRYLPTDAPAAQVTDGWASRYLVAEHD